MNPFKKFIIYTALLSSLIYFVYYYFFQRNILFTQDICHIMDRRPFWNSELEYIEKKYNVSKFTILSFINQESSFRSNARPPFKKVWGFIPTWNRISSSYGYSQAINGSWELFQKQTNNPDAYRGDFVDSSEFIAWYINKSNKINNIDNYDTYNLYLSYHEGWGGYNNQSYLKKPSLLEISKKVEKIKNKYEVQFNQC